jgi:hypothetical protein
MTINKHGQLIVADLFNRRVQVLELGYQEWLQRSEIAPASETPAAEVLDGDQKASEQGQAPPSTDGLGDREAVPEGKTESIIQQGEAQELPGARGEQVPAQNPPGEQPGPVLQQAETPLPPSDTAGSAPAQDMNQEQQETVPEVILPAEKLPAYPASGGK